MKIDLFIPCFVDQIYPSTAMNMVKVLEKAGCEISYNPNQTCCGQPAFNAGYWDEAREVASKFIKDFPKPNVVVAPSASCVGFVRHHYPKLFENSSLHHQANDLSGNVFEFTEFLTDILKSTSFDAVWNGKVTYHDSCSALRECGIKEGPRKLLESVSGLELIEMKDNETCCGFGGSFSVKYAPISTAMADLKVKYAMETGANAIISTDMSCLMQIDGYIKAQQLPMSTFHIADILAAGW